MRVIRNTERMSFRDRNRRVDQNRDRTPELIAPDGATISSQIAYFALLEIELSKSNDVWEEYAGCLEVISKCSQRDLADAIKESQIIGVLRPGAQDNPSVASIITLFESILDNVDDKRSVRSTQEILFAKAPRGLRAMGVVAVTAATLGSALPAAAADNVNSSAASMSSTIIFNGSAAQTPSAETPVAVTTPMSATTTSQPSIEQSPSPQADEVMVFGAAEQQASQNVEMVVPVNQVPQATEVTGLFRIFEQTPEGGLVEATAPVREVKAAIEPNATVKQEGSSSIAELLGVEGLTDSHDILSTISSPESGIDNVKLGSYNILGYYHGDGSTYAKDRLQQIVKNINNMQSDVVGLQEYRDAIRGDKKILEHALRELNPDWRMAYNKYGDQLNYVYDSSTVRLVNDRAVRTFKNPDCIGGTPYVRIATFEKISSGQQFLVINVHPNPQHGKRGASCSRHTADNERMRVVRGALNDRVVSRFQGPKALLGDFNANPTGDRGDEGNVERYLEGAGFANSRDIPNAKRRTGGRIDHIYYDTSSVIAPIAYETMDCKPIAGGDPRDFDPSMTCASDHTPVETIQPLTAPSTQDLN